ncbi:MAG: hypothetical protein F6K30_06900, partial [Cyanothece sp. SIO2G6]|nr:hypothetical protein [Cyanothece sp. SIO2G6]
MKFNPALSTITAVLLGASLATATLPARAQWATDTTEQPTVEPTRENAEPSEIILFEALPTQLLTEDANILNRLADQINQEVDGTSEDFLPDGMVVRGSNSSLQVGSEL